MNQGVAATMTKRERDELRLLAEEQWELDAMMARIESKLDALIQARRFVSRGAPSVAAGSPGPDVVPR